MNVQVFMQQGLDSIGIPYTEEDIDLLALYFHEITLWNDRYRLVNAQGRELIVKHIFDSLAPLPLLRQMKFSTLADAGSGAGLPGIPLALFLKDTKVTLIERSAKRMAFLLNAVSILQLHERVSLLQASVEEVSERFDVVVFRAFRQLDAFYAPLKTLCNPGGVLFAYKGKRETIEKEIAKLPQTAETEILPVTVPFLKEERHILKLRQNRR